MIRAKHIAAISSAGVFFALVILAAGRAYGGPTEIKSVTTSKSLYELPRKNLYGTGVAEDGSSLTVVNGNIYATRLDAKGAIVVDDSFKTKTSSMLYSNVRVWTEIPLTKDVVTTADLHNLINQSLRKFGYENPGTVPFLIKGVFTDASFRIDSKTFAEKNADGIIVGFFSKTVSESTAPTFKSSMNIVLKKKKQAGPVATFSPSTQATLFLPR